ncbi:MAG: DUF2461 domain-containing protein [Cyclobacteriaceae bacterium]
MADLSLVMKFLSDLEKNNTRDWMQDNKKVYQKAKDEFNEFVSQLISGISEFDPDLLGVEPKQCIFRINRDIRFSKDKSPYKNNFGAYMAKGGKKGEGGGYYIHLQPGESFVGGGIYMPPSDKLAKIRQEIDYNPDPLLAVLADEQFKSFYGGLSGEQLKTAPKGYEKDHMNIELLRFKSFVVFRKISNDQIGSKVFVNDVVKGFQLLKPLKDYLSVAIDS